MTYSAVYCALIENRKQNCLSDNEYGEVHHIIPKSEGGNDYDENLVRLSAREHYIAHLLLAKIYDDQKMYSALAYMQTGRHKNRKFKFNSRLYAKMRKEFAIKMQKEKTGIHYFHNGSEERMCRVCPEGFIPGRLPFSAEHCKRISDARKKRTGWKHSEKTKEKMSISALGNKSSFGLHWYNNGQIEIHALECPEGFVPGRLPFSEEQKRKMRLSCKKSNPKNTLHGLNRYNRKRLQQIFHILLCCA